MAPHLHDRDPEVAAGDEKVRLVVAVREHGVGALRDVVRAGEERSDHRTRHVLRQHRIHPRAVQRPSVGDDAGDRRTLLLERPRDAVGTDRAGALAVEQRLGRGEACPAKVMAALVANSPLVVRAAPSGSRLGLFGSGRFAPAYRSRSHIETAMTRKPAASEKTSGVMPGRPASPRKSSSVSSRMLESSGRGVCVASKYPAAPPCMVTQSGFASVRA